eukprot:scaffold26986_cov63-Phaeocystis_antarctica.AAC.1
MVRHPERAGESCAGLHFVGTGRSVGSDKLRGVSNEAFLLREVPFRATWLQQTLGGGNSERSLRISAN